MQRQKTPIKIIILYSSGHLGSSIILNKLLKMNCYEVCGIIKAQTFQYSSNDFKKIHKKSKKVGLKLSSLLIWQRLIQILSFLISKVLPISPKSLLSSKQLTSNISVHKCHDINSQSSLSFISDCNPDMLISAYFPQILKVKALNSSPLGVLNIHPGWLPTFKGCMSYFHVICQNQKKAGVSIHWMDEGIDTGQLLARKSFKLNSKMTQESTMVKTAFIGASLLKRIGLTLSKGKTPKPITPSPDEIDKYYPMPQKKDYEAYSQKHRFFRIRDIIGLICWRPLRHYFNSILRRTHKV